MNQLKKIKINQYLIDDILVSFQAENTYTFSSQNKAEMLIGYAIAKFIMESKEYGTTKNTNI